MPPTLPQQRPSPDGAQHSAAPTLPLVSYRRNSIVVDITNAPSDLGFTPTSVTVRDVQEDGVIRRTVFVTDGVEHVRYGVRTPLDSMPSWLALFVASIAGTVPVPVPA